MSKTIKERNKELQLKEDALKLQLEMSGDDLKSKAKSVGKIALVSGIVAFVGYWVYQSFFADEEEEDIPKKKRKSKRNKESNSLTNRLSAFATPYIVSFLDELLELKDVKSDGKETEKKPD